MTPTLATALYARGATFVAVDQRPGGVVFLTPWGLHVIIALVPSEQLARVADLASGQTREVALDVGAILAAVDGEAEQLRLLG